MPSAGTPAKQGTDAPGAPPCRGVGFELTRPHGSKGCAPVKSKKWTVLLAATLSTFCLTIAHAQRVCDTNLVQNPGCEEPLVSGEIPSWTESGGSQWTCRSTNPQPIYGAAFFAPFQGDSVELVQEVDITGSTGYLASFSISGLVWTADESPSDVARVIFEFLGPGGVLLGSYDTGELSTGGAWMGIGCCCECHPHNTEVVRVRLLGLKRSGTQLDAVFDDIRVFPHCPDPIESTTWGHIKSRLP